MKYMFLIYSQERPGGPDPDQIEAIKARHWAVMQEAKQKGILLAVEGLKPTATATTVRIQDGKPITLDGPFAETKEQLAGYYILECHDLNEAMDWATRIPSSCKGMEGCIEIRPVAELPRRP
ncbi:MAG: YciI family protein [Terriglobia bacterium]|nr:MAG: YciI family protein [Terriglobia bacterium]